jgi:hypothetical protein
LGIELVEFRESWGVGGGGGGNVARKTAEGLHALARAAVAHRLISGRRGRERTA